jgi:iron complex outermembrane receptor protein
MMLEIPSGVSLIPNNTFCLMLKPFLLCFLSFVFINITYCQTVDSINLNEVTVNAYLSGRPLLRLPASASVIDSSELKKQSGQSLVPLMNTVPGVRMEERSPGSYRLSIRGSLLRSPFGIRNVKMYIDQFPLTDAGGNTYLNLLDLNAVRSIEVLKGPDGSLFGANSGGIVRLNVFSQDTSNRVRLGIGGGSFGLCNEYAFVNQHINKNILSIGEGWQHADGYRQNSRFDRTYLQLTDQLNYRNNVLKFLLFYTHLKYQTPGGLTEEQWINNPSTARPPSKTPGAAEQKAGILNSTFYGGISNQLKLNKTWNHELALFGSYTDFENPFITNYEVRNEHTYGVRTWLEASNHREGEILLKFNTGIEAARTVSNIKNYGNFLGTKDTIQKFDNLSVNQSFVFSHLIVDFYNKWLLECGLSLNMNQLSFYTRAPSETGVTKHQFDPQLMPKIAASYQLASFIALRASVSKGYSPPTLAEIRSSDNRINTTLQPENGWNYETGIRLHTRKHIIWWDIAAFYYLLKNAIVLRVNESGQEYFVNAGGTQQSGIESQLIVQLIRERKTKFIRGIDIRNSLTINSFIFDNYSNKLNDYSGNKLTGVPTDVSVSGLMLHFPLQLYLFLQHTYTSSIFLNDANTVSTRPSSIFLIKGGWKLVKKADFQLELSAGIDNLTNEKYSLGNDLNAIGGRYFNAAMPRNYFCRLEIRF